MIAIKLYVIRHGESENNVKKCWTGWMQVSLTEKGYKDAERIRSFMQSRSFDKIYTSDLIRAKQTAETALPGCDYEETELIREINVGSLAGRTFEECEREYGEVFEENKKNTNYLSYGGENGQMFQARLQEFLDIVVKSGHETVAAFAHNGVLRRLLHCVLGYDVSRNMLRPNCAIAVFEYSGSGWLLDSWINPNTVFDKQ